MDDQRRVWDDLYQRPSVSGAGEEPSELALEVSSMLASNSRVLELGCGSGRDAAYFADLGLSVIAVDFSTSAIGAARKRYASQIQSALLSFDVADISAPYPWPDQAFDAVYARLSLHYFSDASTKTVFAEIARVLITGGLLAFTCRSVEDPLYGKGIEVAPDIFESHHLRHFFSEAFASECLQRDFDALAIETVKAELYGEESVYVKAVAKRR